MLWPSTTTLLFLRSLSGLMISLAHRPLRWPMIRLLYRVSAPGLQCVFAGRAACAMLVSHIENEANMLVTRVMFHGM